MKLATRPVLLLLLACAIAVMAAQRAVEPPYAGASYVGEVAARIVEPGLPPTREDTGTGTARFVELGGGKSRLVVTASVRKPNDAGFSIEGGEDASGWSGRTDDLRLRIDPDGIISGGGVVDGNRITFGGRAEAGSLDLRVEMRMLQSSARGVFPVGTTTVFNYALERRDGDDDRIGLEREPSPAAAKDDGRNECKRTVWTTRNVASPGGGMTMIQVPHCVD